METANRRHGDINCIAKSIDTKGLKLLWRQKFTVAEGETTWHHHVIEAWIKSTVNVYQLPNGNMVIEVDWNATITHPEHKPIEFPTGTWEVIREREYDYFTKSTKRVQD